MTLRSIAMVMAALVTVPDLVWADADPCGPVLNVITRMNAAPRLQQHGTVTHDGKSYSSDLQAFGDKEYARKGAGSWRSGPRQLVPLVVDGKAAVFDCRRVGSEDWGGIATTVYTYKRRMPLRHIVRDVRLWVADGTGLAVHSRIAIHEGGTIGGAEFTQSYDPDATPPEGAPTP